jgi:hypothetical protein
LNNFDQNQCGSLAKIGQGRYNNNMPDNQKTSLAKVVKIVRLGSEPKAAEYWRTLSYEARLAALEQIRQEYHHWKNDAQPGFQRVCTIVKQ